MDIEITPGRLRGTVAAPPSKSASHRALIAAALGDRPTVVRLGEASVDVQMTLDCLVALGAQVLPTKEKGTVEIHPTHPSKSGQAALQCGESGSTLRFMLPVAAALGGHFTFSGKGRLPKRPLAPLPELLRDHGCAVQGECLDMTVSGRLQGGRYLLPGHISSQYLTGLLLALPLLEQDSEIRLTTPLESAPYVELTLETLRDFGIVVERKADAFFLPGRQTYRSPGEITVEGDWSGAAFYLCAGAIGAPVTVTNLRRDSRQGDKAIGSLLRDFGADVQWEDDKVTVSPKTLDGLEISMEEIPDLFCILAVVAAAAQGKTVLRGAARLRLKESDRIASTAKMLEGLGTTVRSFPDALEIWGTGAFSGGEVHSAGDHRIAMAAAIAASVSEGPVTLRQAQVAEKSYSAFFREYSRLGGVYCVL